MRSELVVCFFRVRTKSGRAVVVRGIDLGLDMGEEYFVSLFQWEDVSVLSRVNRMVVELGGQELRINEDYKMLEQYGLLVESLELV